MKKNFTAAYKYLLLFVLTFTQVLVWAQDSSVSSHSNTTVTTKTTSEFVMQPWMWVVGGAVVLIIIMALLRGNSNKEVSRTTVVRDDRSTNR